MKKIFALTALSLLLFVGCKKDDEVAPSDISDITSTELPGAIKIQWKKQEPVTFEYIKVSYLDKLTNQKMVRLVSSYTDEIEIPNTRAKFGAYEFEIQAFSKDNVAGQLHKLSATSGAASITITYTEEQVELTASDLSSNAKEPSEGSFAALLDNNSATYFHSTWSRASDAVHYLQADANKVMKAFKFGYRTRANGNNYPVNIKIEGSTDGTSWEEMTTITSGLPTGAAANYKSDVIWNEKSFTKFRFWVTRTKDGQKWFVMSEFQLYDQNPVVVDPEQD